MGDVKTIEDISDLTPDPANANEGTERGLRMLDDSLREDGAGRSILVDRDGVIVAGNKTLERAADIGLPVRVVQTDGTELVVVQRTDLDLDGQGEEQVRARRMAYRDNRSSEISLSWDIDQLLADVNAGIDLSGVFRQDEIDELLAEVREAEAPEDPGADMSKADELQEKWGTCVGQCWELGSHRLVIGDCTDAAVVESVMRGERADVAINDPPYGMRLDADFSGMVNKLGFACAKGIKGGTRYDNIIGDAVDFDAEPVVALIPEVREQFWFGADYYSSSLPDTEHSGAWLAWDKRLDESADKMFGSCFELIWSRQRHKRDILRHKWAGVFGTEKEPQRGRVHPAQKPVVLIEDLLARYSVAGACVLDMFAGSGTTIIACERLGRKARAIELDPGYCAVAIQRFYDMTQVDPRLLAT